MVKLGADPGLQIPRLRPRPGWSWAQVRFIFLLICESECTSERALGQFSIFGAVEENAGHGFSRIGMDQECFQRSSAKPRSGRGFVFAECTRRKILETAEADCAQ